MGCAAQGGRYLLILTAVRLFGKTPRGEGLFQGRPSFTTESREDTEGSGRISAGRAADGFHRGGQRRAFEGGSFARGAAGSVEAGAVGLHGFFFTEDGEGFAEDLRGAGIGGDDDAVVHPLPFPAGVDDAGAAEIGEVAGDFGLALAENFDKETDANLASVHEIEETEAGAIGKGREEEGQVRVL